MSSLVRLRLVCLAISALATPLRAASNSLLAVRYLLCLLALGVGVVAPAQAGPWPLLHRPQPYLRFVTQVVYQGEALLQKRTPPTKLPRKGATTIRALEARLSTRYQALLRSDTACVLSVAQRDSLYRAISEVRTNYPTWNSLPYTQEALFYERTQARRQLHYLQQRFCQAQQQRERLQEIAHLAIATASFAQAARAGRTAQQAQQWVQAEVYFARCRTLRPTDSASTVRYALVAQRCLAIYFSDFLQRADLLWQTGYQSTGSQPRHWPAYTAAVPQLEYYLLHLSAAYQARCAAGQWDYLYQQVETLLSAKHLLPATKAVACVSQAHAAVQAYGRCYGNDGLWGTCRGLLAEAEQDRRLR